VAEPAREIHFGPNPGYGLTVEAKESFHLGITPEED